MENEIDKEESIFKEIFNRDGIVYFISKDTTESDAKLIFDSLNHIRTIFKKRKIALNLNDILIA